MYEEPKLEIIKFNIEERIMNSPGAEVSGGVVDEGTDLEPSWGD